MNIRKMKKWICNNDIKNIIYNGCKVKNELVCICQKNIWLYEKSVMYPILININNTKEYLKSINWDFHSSNPKIISLNRSNYLCEIFKRNCPGIQLIGNKYINSDGKTIALIENIKDNYKKKFSIEISSTELKKMLTIEKKELFIVFENYRYSERTLVELSLKDERKEIYKSNSCFSFSSRPINSNFFSEIDIFSTITTFRGKTKFKIENENNFK